MNLFNCFIKWFVEQFTVTLFRLIHINFRWNDIMELCVIVMMQYLQKNRIPWNTEIVNNHFDEVTNLPRDFVESTVHLHLYLILI